MPIKTRRFRKKNNKSRRARKNNTRRRYKKNMRGGGTIPETIKNETELKNSWNKKEKETDRFLIQAWEADDGRGTRQRYYREGYTYEQLKNSLSYFFKMMKINEADTKRREDEKGFIVEIYY